MTVLAASSLPLFHASGSPPYDPGSGFPARNFPGVTPKYFLNEHTKAASDRNPAANATSVTVAPLLSIAAARFMRSPRENFPGVVPVFYRKSLLK